MKPSQTATTKPIETHEIQPHHQSQIPLPCFYLDWSRGTLEFDEGGAGGVSWEQGLGVVGLGSTMKLGSAMELRSVVRWRTRIVSVR